LLPMIVVSATIALGMNRLDLACCMAVPFWFASNCERSPDGALAKSGAAIRYA